MRGKKQILQYYQSALGRLSVFSYPQTTERSSFSFGREGASRSGYMDLICRGKTSVLEYDSDSVPTLKDIAVFQSLSFPLPRPACLLVAVNIWLWHD